LDSFNIESSQIFETLENDDFGINEINEISGISEISGINGIDEIEVKLEELTEVDITVEEVEWSPGFQTEV
jgi:hypothetical protein